jgi:hypothetical protein
VFVGTVHLFRQNRTKFVFRTRWSGFHGKCKHNSRTVQWARRTWMWSQKVESQHEDLALVEERWRRGHREEVQ